MNDYSEHIAKPGLTEPDKKPFRMIVTGASDCGKTRYVLDMLESECMGRFDYIVIICPTVEDNTTYQWWKYIEDPYVFEVKCPPEHVGIFVEMTMIGFKGSETLLIIDDCASTTDIKMRTGSVANLFTHGRHSWLSSIIVTQQLTSINKPSRENLTKLVMFYASNASDMKALTDNYMYGVKAEEISRIVHDLREHPYSRLEVNLKHPYDYKVVKPTLYD